MSPARAGLARLHDLLRGDPKAVGVLLSVELCSLTVQRDDPSMANLVASGLFGEAARLPSWPWAPSTLGRARRSSTAVSHLYPDTERAMGWDIGASGLKVVLGAEVPDLVTMYLGDDVRRCSRPTTSTSATSASGSLTPADRRCSTPMQDALDLTDGAASTKTWQSLAEVGNLSSASVLHVLRDTLDQRDPARGPPGCSFAMGPGFCAELVLLRW